MKFLMVLQTHTTSSNDHQREQLRYCGAKKPEVTKRCVRSLLASVRHAKRMLPQIDFFLKVFDDHSDQESVNTMLTELQNSGIDYDFEALSTRGIMPSILKCYEYGRDAGEDLVYFVQDDYLYFESCIYEMIVDFGRFSEIVGAPIAIYPYNDPYRYLPHNLVEKVHVFQGSQRFWRSNFHPSSCIMVHHSVLTAEWDLFEAMGRSRVYSGMEQDTIGKLFIDRGHVMFTPIPSLSLHMQLETERDPFIDWQSLWDQFADQERAEFVLPEGNIFLNVGCGRTRVDLSRFGGNLIEVRVDADARANADIIGTIQDLSAIPSGSVKVVYASHVLEHVYWHELSAVMQEFQRVLGPDGLAVIGVPNLASIADLFKDARIVAPVYQSPGGPIAPLDMVYGYRPYTASGMDGMQHKIGFNPFLLSGVLRESGWRNTMVIDEGTQVVGLAAMGRLPENPAQFLGL